MNTTRLACLFLLLFFSFCSINANDSNVINLNISSYDKSTEIDKFFENLNNKSVNSAHVGNANSQSHSQAHFQSRFASIKANEANARRGPGIYFPIEWIYLNKWEPVEIIAEYEQWRRIRDWKGDTGWLHTSVLSAKRYVAIVSDFDEFLYSSSSYSASKIAILKPELRCKFLKCRESWCKISCNNIDGWVHHSKLWGVNAGDIG